MERQERRGGEGGGERWREEEEGRTKNNGREMREVSGGTLY